MPLPMMVHDSIQDLTSLLEHKAHDKNNEAPRPPRKPEQEANPQQPPSLFRYAGQYEYSDGYYHNFTPTSSGGAYYQDNDRPITTSVGKNGRTTNHTLSSQHQPARSNNNIGPHPLLRCLFPWMQHQQEHLQDDDEEEDEHASNGNGGANMSNDDGSATSNNSNLLGEKLSQRERLAVLNRLGLPVDNLLHESTSTTTTTGGGDGTTSTMTTGRSSHNTKSNLLNGIPVSATSPLEQEAVFPRGPLKGILKRSENSMMGSSSSCSTSQLSKSPTKTTTTTSSSNNNNSTATSCLPRRSLFPTTYEKRTNKAVSFAPMARVVTVKSKNDMEYDEKSAVWWQRTDYEEFRRTGRIITKSSSSSPNSSPNPSGTTALLLLSPEEEEAAAAVASTTTTASLPHKWWHSFGHSRRGLEHVVSSDEGRQRQQNVKLAIAAVLKEQSRATTDTMEKLRAVSLNYTSWARDLALAAGASDADAVARGFGEDRKSREFFLLKQQQQQQQRPIFGSGNTTTTAAKNNSIVPDFMQPRTKTKLQQRMLDANISRRPVRRSLLQPPLSPPQQLAPQHPTRTSASTASTSLTTVVATKDDNGDDDDDDGEGSLAQQAAGFGAGGQKHDMAAVLTGAATAV
jgi:hypothetical protein